MDRIIVKTYSLVFPAWAVFATWVAIGLIASTSRASLIAFDMNGITPNGGSVYAPGVGFRFTVGAAPLQLDALSCAMWVSDWNTGTSSSANLDAQNIRVKLWRSADQALLADAGLNSLDFAGDLAPNPNNYAIRYFREGVPGITLGAGQDYVIALYGTTNTGGNLQYINNLHNAVRPVTVAPDILFNNGNLYTPGGSPGAIPSMVDSAGNPKFGGPSFEYTVVPEPSSMALAFAGLFILRHFSRKGVSR